MPPSSPEIQATRLMLYYKGNISALLLFAQHANGSICLPEPLPALSSALEPDEIEMPRKISVHPSFLIQTLNERLQLPNDLLSAEPGFHEPIDTPNGIVTVYMARFNVLDPPHGLMRSRGFSLQTLPALRGRPPAEMELLRRAYAKVMES